MNHSIPTLILFLSFSGMPSTIAFQWLLPIEVKCRTDLTELKLSSIGQFGFKRKARKTVPAHVHTGIDILRPNNNYDNEKIFPVCNGVVISIRDDGPFAQIIIEHRLANDLLWTVYEHIADISCHVGDSVSPALPIARFFSRSELNSYGWQFDHFHFEVLKQKPIEIAPTRILPNRHFNTYALTCFTYPELLERYYDPIEFYSAKFKTASVDSLRH
jgi:hypothetical protein